MSHLDGNWAFVITIALIVFYYTIKLFVNRPRRK